MILPRGLDLKLDVALHNPVDDLIHIINGNAELFAHLPGVASADGVLQIADAGDAVGASADAEQQLLFGREVKELAHRGHHLLLITGQHPVNLRKEVQHVVAPHSAGDTSE